MKQVLHIFLKDVHRYWAEIVVSIALLAAFARNDIGSWTHPGGVAFGVGGLFSTSFLVGLVTVLLPVAWAFVIVRVIQAESLVGDRQFWITRPYEWKKLLGAKILFVFAFVNVPLLIMDIFLLVKAGFVPTHHIVGLLWMQLLLVLYLLLPVATLATVTQTLAQMLLTALGVVLYIIGMAWLSNKIPSSSFSSPADYLQGALFISTCVVVILLQYARRRTEKSRWLVAGFAFAILLVMIATPYRAIVAHEFPPLGTGEQSPFRVTLVPANTTQSEPDFQSGKKVQIQLPLLVSGVDSDSIVVISGVLVEIEAENGVRWNSGWTSPGLSLFSDTKNTQIDFTLTKKTYERMKASPVQARIGLAFTLFSDRNKRSFVVPQGPFAMPDMGPCSANPAYRSIHCLSALKRPPSLLVTADLSETTCRQDKNEPPAKPGEVARGWNQNGDWEPAEFGISPVQTVEINLHNWYPFSPRRDAGICPGTPVIFSNPQPVRRNQTVLRIDSLRLEDYRLAPLRFTIGNLSVKVR